MTHDIIEHMRLQLSSSRWRIIDEARMSDAYNRIYKAMVANDEFDVNCDYKDVLERLTVVFDDASDKAACIMDCLDGDVHAGLKHKCAIRYGRICKSLLKRFYEK